MDSNLQKTQNAPTFGGMDAEAIAAGLSEAQREYVLHGPYPHWTQTHRALGRKGIAPLKGIRGLNELGETVRAILLRDQGEE